MATAPSHHRGQIPRFDWRAQLGSRLVSADDAVAHIKSGDRVALSIAQATPFELCPALAGRLMELEDVVVHLGRWGAKSLGDPRCEEIITVDSLIMAMRSTFRPEAARKTRASYEFRFGAIIFNLRIDGAKLEVAEGPLPGADLSLRSFQIRPLIESLLKSVLKCDRGRGCKRNVVGEIEPFR